MRVSDGVLMSGIFVSYRRDDTAGSAGRIYDRLASYFGPQRVFFDRSTISPGSDFRSQALDRVASAEAVVVVIGERWLTCLGGNGERRLDDPRDLVRQEVETALKRGIRLFPVLVSGARFPTREDLPAALRGLCRFNALEVAERSFLRDVDCLIEAINASLPSPGTSLHAPGPVLRKVCMAGSFGVGKTSLVERFVQSIFDERYHTTIGAKIDQKVVAVGPRRVQLILWDLAGEDEATPLRLSHFRGASGYILVADGLRTGTLEKAHELRRRVEDALGMLPFVVAINKCDLRSEWQIGDEVIDQLSNSWAVFETSAKTGWGVEEMFRSLAGKVLPVEGTQ